MENYLTIKEVAEKWNLTPRRVQKMCAEGLIDGISKFGRSWVIPADAERPKDGRISSGNYVNWRKNKKESVD